MAAPKNGAIAPKLVIDLHGMREVLSTRKNSVRSASINAIESGEMYILRSVSDNLKDLYPNLYDTFKDIKQKKYLHVSVAAEAAAATLIETFGASILGSNPSIEHFNAISATLMSGATLVSHGKGLSDCRKIVKKCGLSDDSVISIDDVS